MGLSLQCIGYRLWSESEGVRKCPINRRLYLVAACVNWVPNIYPPAKDKWSHVPPVSLIWSTTNITYLLKHRSISNSKRLRKDHWIELRREKMLKDNMSIKPQEAYFSEFLPKIQMFLFKKIHCWKCPLRNGGHFVGFNMLKECPDSKVHGANMGPTWVLSAPDGGCVVPMNLAIRVTFKGCCPAMQCSKYTFTLTIFLWCRVNICGVWWYILIAKMTKIPRKHWEKYRKYPEYVFASTKHPR